MKYHGHTHHICGHLHFPPAAEAAEQAAGAAVHVGHAETAVTQGLPVGQYHMQHCPKHSLPLVEGGAQQEEGPLHVVVAMLLSFFHCTCMNSAFRNQYFGMGLHKNVPTSDSQFIRNVTNDTKIVLWRVSRFLGKFAHGVSVQQGEFLC